MSVLDLTPVTSKTVAFYISRDLVLSQVRNWIYKDGLSGDLLTFNHTQSGRMSYQDNWVVFYGDHGWLSCHESRYFTKSIAFGSSGNFTPKLDADIELCVRSCDMCQDSANMPQASALHLWECPGRP